MTFQYTNILNHNVPHYNVLIIVFITIISNGLAREMRGRLRAGEMCESRATKRRRPACETRGPAVSAGASGLPMRALPLGARARLTGRPPIVSPVGRPGSAIVEPPALLTVSKVFSGNRKTHCYLERCFTVYRFLHLDVILARQQLSWSLALGESPVCDVFDFFYKKQCCSGLKHFRVYCKM